MTNSPPQRPPVWLWPNLLGLDAPLVALTWQAFLALAIAVPLRPIGRITLGLTVWIIYLADRLLDVRGAPTTRETERHRFHRRHNRLLWALLILALCADLAAVFFWLRPAVFRTGLLPFGAVILYMGIVHRQRIPIPKELAVALLFTAGTFLIGWTFSEHRLALLPPAAAFLTLCLGNLVAIEMWEWRELRDSHGKPPHRATILLERTLPWWMGALILIAIASPTPWFLAIAASTVAILMLHRAGARLSLNARRVLVDAALLTPLPWLIA
ncbi:MAG: hypothetical protein JST93_16105 [Acidobacteria bacterium]|nr:hypothetical protein [Acidobacteriota bacterium]